MACYKVQLPGGAVAIVCGVKPRVKKCATCGRPAARECDWCDQPVCSTCATRKGSVDACPEHNYEFQEREAIQGDVVPAAVKIDPLDNEARPA